MDDTQRIETPPPAGEPDDVPAEAGEAPGPAGPLEVQPLLRRLLQAFQQDDVGGLAAEMAFRFLFAIFPFGVFVAALTAFVAAALHVENPAARLLAGLGDNLPPSIADSVKPELTHLLGTTRPELLSIGAVAALIAANGGTQCLIKAMHRAYDVPETRPLVLRYLVSLALTLIAAAGVLASFVTVVGGAAVTRWLADITGLGSTAPGILDLVRWPIVFVGLTFAVALLYRYAPNLVAPWRWILAGSVAFTTGWLITTAALGWYVDHVADYGATYGSLGGVIVLMLWFYASAFLLIAGAELTAALANLRSPAEIRPRREEAVAGAKVREVEAEARRKVTG
ncbi:MAG TPA: YihY/virulence factor BrkB family protein [Candidatus Limnocylindrales bacterium]